MMQTDTATLSEQLPVRITVEEPMPASYFLRIAGVVVGAVIAGLLAIPAALALGDVWSRTVLGAQWTGLDWDIGRVLSAIGMLILAWLVLLGLDEKIRQWMSEK